MHLSYATSIWRWPAAAALSATAAIHMTLVPDHLREAPYAGALFIALSAAALATAIVLSATSRLTASIHYRDGTTVAATVPDVQSDAGHSDQPGRTRPDS